jgi:hypothetical protein
LVVKLLFEVAFSLVFVVTSVQLGEQSFDFLVAFESLNHSDGFWQNKLKG